MKALPIITCILIFSGSALWQPVQGQEQTVFARTTENLQAGSSAGSNATFAVTLIRYEVSYTPVQKQVLVNWQTISETNNIRFEVERSTNGQNFVKVGALPGNPNSTSIQYYRFADKAPLQGKSFYRLKQISADSSSSFSRSLAVTTRLTGNLIAVTVSPNPCPHGDCEVMVSNPATGTPTIVEILDQNSRVIFSRSLPEHTPSTRLLPQDVAGLKGMYFLRVRSGSETVVQRIMLK